MKKLFIILFLSLFLVSCTDTDLENIRIYEEMINILNDAAEYNTSSSHYSISINFSRTAQEKRYYIVIDDPQIAMYDVKAIAFEEGPINSDEACPNVGIFDESINLVPNQINKEKGFVKGISISGVYSGDEPTILCLVQWINEDNTKVYREYFRLGTQIDDTKENETSNTNTTSEKSLEDDIEVEKESEEVDYSNSDYSNENTNIQDNSEEVNIYE